MWVGLLWRLDPLLIGSTEIPATQWAQVEIGGS